MDIESTMLALLRERGASTACPSEVARAVFPAGWREHMEEVRKVAAQLVERGLVEVFQHGRPVPDILHARGPVRLRAAGLAAVDFRAEPSRYRIGRGEEGVLTVEPYKSELLPLWRFRTPELARKSSAALWKRFVGYRRAADFVGMDMARKFIQMGWTRARRYANHPSGRKYGPGRRELPRVEDPAKAEAAAVFREVLDQVLADPVYVRLRKEHECRTPKSRKAVRAPSARSKQARSRSRRSGTSTS